MFPYYKSNLVCHLLLDNINSIHKESNLGAPFFHTHAQNLFFTFAPQGQKHRKILIKIQGLNLFSSRITEAKKGNRMWI